MTSDIFIIKSNVIPANVFYLKSVQIEPVFVEHFVSIGGGGGTKIKEIWPWLLLFVSMDSIDMKKKKEVADVISRRLLSLAINN